MPYHPRIEAPQLTNFTTIRTHKSALWLINNKKLETHILANLAKCVERHKVTLYAFAIEGSHKHELAKFPSMKRAQFHRDFNADVARGVKKYCPDFEESKLWYRRYSNEFVPRDIDVEEEFFYTALQPVQDGLVEKLSQYPGYNFFNDAVSGTVRKHKIVDWSRYNSDKRWKKKIKIKDYTTVYSLKYERLPGYEHLSQREYKKMMHQKLEERRLVIVRERYSSGKGFLGAEELKKTPIGTRAKSPKVSTRYSHRPRVLCLCPETRALFKSWYFRCLNKYWEASDIYLSGECDAHFPSGMYKPPLFTGEYLMSREDFDK